MMNFFGRNCYQWETKEPIRNQWIRVENGLPDGDRDVQTLIYKEHYDGTVRYVVEMQKFKPSNGWMNSNGVVAWKELDYEMLELMKEKR